MKKIKKMLLLLGTLLTLTACAPKVITPETLGTISKLGVISLHGTQMEVIERGITIFGNEDMVNDISKWNLDEYLQQTMLKSLKNKKMELISLSLAKEVINSHYEDDKSFNNILEKLMKEKNIDTLLVLERGPIIPEHNLFTRGVTVIKAKMIGVHKTNIGFNFAMLTYRLVDGKLKIIQMSRFLNYKNISNDLWIDTKKPINEESLQKIESYVKETLGDILPKNIKEAGF